MTSLGPEMNVLLQIVDDLREKVSEVQSQQQRQEENMGALRGQVDTLKAEISNLQQRQRQQSRPSSNASSVASASVSGWRTPSSTRLQRAEWVRMGLCGRCGDSDHVVRKCPLQPFRLVEKVEGRPWRMMTDTDSLPDDARSESYYGDSDTDNRSGSRMSFRS